MSGQHNPRYHNQVRIIGGLYKRRILHFPTVEGLRPTPDRVRETVFNWLGQTLIGCRCLDLFAGTGAFGFEALSRGAETVCLIEKQKAAFHALKKNAQDLNFPTARYTLLQTDAYRFLTQTPPPTPFDVIFIDPPYAEAAHLPALLTQLKAFVTPTGYVYLESPAVLTPADHPGWNCYRQDKAGMVHYALLTPESCVS